MTAVLPQHLSKTVNHGTPEHIIEAARKCLGSIDLDPATSEAFNHRVRAKRIFTAETGSLNRDWGTEFNPVTVFLNPPGVVEKGKRSLAPKFWDKLVSQYLLGHVSEAIYIGFSLEQLQTLQRSENKFPSDLDIHICIPDRRLQYLTEEGRCQGSPPQGSFIAYIGQFPEDFQECFNDIGMILKVC